MERDAHLDTFSSDKNVYEDSNTSQHASEIILSSNAGAQSNYLNNTDDACIEKYNTSNQIPAEYLQPVTPTVSTSGQMESKHLHDEAISSQGADSNIETPMAPQSEMDFGLQSLIHKKMLFFKCKEWEDDRVAKLTVLKRTVEPICDELYSAVQLAVLISNQTAKFLKNRSKIDAEYAKSLKTITAASKTQKYSLIQSNKIQYSSYRPNTASQKVDKATASNASVIESVDSVDIAHKHSIQKMSRRHSSSKEREVSGNLQTTAIPQVQHPSQESDDEHGNASHKKCSGQANSLTPEAVHSNNVQAAPEPFFSDSATHCWLISLMELNRQKSLQLDSLASFVEFDVVQNHLLRTNREFEARSNNCVNAIKKHAVAFSRAEDTSKKAWMVFETHFRESWKAYTNRTTQCNWLLERNYHRQVDNCAKVAKKWLEIVLECLVTIQKLEKVRSETTRQLLCSVIERMKSSCNVLQTTISSIHEMLGYSTSGPSVSTEKGYLGSGNYYYRRMIKENLKSIETNMTDDEKAIVNGTCSNELPKYKYLTDLLTQNSVDTAKVSHGKSKTEESEESKSESKGHLTRATTLKNAFCLIDISDLPTSTLTMKSGDIMRITTIGPFSKSQDCFLVITWDRFLHLFKSESDSTPILSFSLFDMEMKHEEKKVKSASPVIIELRETKRSFLNTGRNLVFCPQNPDMINSWLVSLQILTTDNLFNDEIKKKTLEHPVMNTTQQFQKESNDPILKEEQTDVETYAIKQLQNEHSQQSATVIEGHEEANYDNCTPETADADNDTDTTLISSGVREFYGTALSAHINPFGDDAFETSSLQGDEVYLSNLACSLNF